MSCENEILELVQQLRIIMFVGFGGLFGGLVATATIVRITQL